MKLIVESQERHLHFYLPNSLLTSRLTIRLISKAAKMSKAQAKPLFKQLLPKTLHKMKKALKAYKKKHGKLVLIDVVSAEGEKVKIVI
jgi:hypothetical protein